MTLIQDLIRAGLIERVTPDHSLAAAWLEDASRHLTAAQAILDVDLAGSYTLAYDAARKAVAAHMVAHGIRMRSVPGAHRALASYAEFLDPADSHLRRLDEMRRNRNRSEYAHRIFGRQEVKRDWEIANAIVAKVETLLAP